VLNVYYLLLIRWFTAQVGDEIRYGHRVRHIGTIGDLFLSCSSRSISYFISASLFFR
jgi:hypothetical protein